MNLQIERVRIIHSSDRLRLKRIFQMAPASLDRIRIRDK